MDDLAGSEWFSVLDQTRAYYQGYINPKDQDKTAFVTPWGLYQWVRVPFGLKNAPAGFQRFMEETVEEFRNICAVPFLDDVILYSKTFLDHDGYMRSMLRCLKKRGIKLKASKCELFRRQVKYLGRMVNAEGYRMDDRNIEAVTKLKSFVPNTIGDVRQLLGLVGYHRRHIQDFSQIAKPVSDLLLMKDIDEEKVVKGKKNKGLSSKTKIIWTEIHQKSLNKLIDLISSPPILAYPDFNEEFFMHTDASLKGLGCILYQKQKGETRVLGYGSRTLTSAEQKYHSSKLEFMALKWGVTVKFRDYLAYANHFVVFTDNNPLLYILQPTKLNSCGQRWVSELSEFNFSIKYRPGVINRDADCLSRLPLDINEYTTLCTEEVTLDSFQAIVAGIGVQSKDEETWKVVINCAEVNVNVGLQVDGMEYDKNKIREEQLGDHTIAEMMKIIKNESENVNKQEWDTETKLLYSQRKKLVINKDGILMRNDETYEQRVTPKSLRKLVFKLLHCEMGHLGVDRVFKLARQRLYWPKMYADIKRFIGEECHCVAQKRPHIKPIAPMQSISTSAPMEMVAIDYLHLEKASGGYEYILLIVDHFTRYAQGYATKNKSALAAAKHLYGDFILRFGIPAKILHDQGREFENKLFSELEKLCSITKRRTTPYHPQGNGCVERMNSTLLAMLRTLPEDRKYKWNEYVNKMLFAYNSTQHDSTHYSPHFLMFGREPKLPIDSILGLGSSDVNTHSEFAQKWKDQMSEAYKVAERNSNFRKGKDCDRINRKKNIGSMKKQF